VQYTLFNVHLWRQKPQTSDRFPLSSNTDISGIDPQTGLQALFHSLSLSRCSDIIRANSDGDGFMLLYIIKTSISPVKTEFLLYAGQKGPVLPDESRKKILGPYFSIVNSIDDIPCGTGYLRPPQAGYRIYS
jgi:hypothetical protein